MPNLDFPDGEFEKDSLDLWNHLDDDAFVNQLTSKQEKQQRKNGEDPLFLRRQLTLLMENSLEVVKDCVKLRKQYTKSEQYFKANEARVASIIHQNFADRLKRLLGGEEALPKDLPSDGQTTYIE